MRHIKGFICITIITFFLSGCAAMFKGTTQQINFRSNDPDVTFYVNEQFIGKGSAVTTFKKNIAYTITARKKGCQDMLIAATKSFDPITLLGILIDYGIVTILIVDGAATGAWQQFDQTSYVMDPLQCE